MTRHLGPLGAVLLYAAVVILFGCIGYALLHALTTFIAVHSPGAGA